MGPDVATVRQNLALILDNGVPAARTAGRTHDGAWGATLGNQRLRVAVGCRRRRERRVWSTSPGPGLSAVTLAILLQRAGCVRAMELDINSQLDDGVHVPSRRTRPNPAAVERPEAPPRDAHATGTATSSRASATSSRFFAAH